MTLQQEYTQDDLKIFVGTFYKGFQLDLEKALAIFKIEFGYIPRIIEGEKTLHGNYKYLFKKYSTPEYFKCEHFDFLLALQENGATNMFGAGEYVGREFGIQFREYQAIIKFYLNHYKELYHPEDLI